METNAKFQVKMFFFLLYNLFCFDLNLVEQRSPFKQISWVGYGDGGTEKNLGRGS